MTLIFMTHLAPYLIDITTAYPQSACPIYIPAVALRRAHNNAAIKDDPRRDIYHARSKDLAVKARKDPLPRRLGMCLEIILLHSISSQEVRQHTLPYCIKVPAMSLMYAFAAASHPPISFGV